MDLDELTLLFGNTLLDFGAKDVELLQVEQKTKYVKRMVLCTVLDNDQAKTFATNFKEKFDNLKCFHTDGIFKGEWVVLDYDEIIVHIFTKEARQKYNIEKLYKGSKNFVKLEQKK